MLTSFVIEQKAQEAQGAANEFNRPILMCIDHLSLLTTLVMLENPIPSSLSPMKIYMPENTEPASDE